MDSSPDSPTLSRLLETALYVRDVSASMDFYRDVLGLRVIQGADLKHQDGPPFAALLIPGGSVLLIFQIGANQKPLHLAGGTIPAHDGRGILHLAFAVPAKELDRWRKRLADLGLKIESEMTWPRENRSIYFRDPDHNLVELATSSLWEASGQ
jgi:catechol 2,3-dioxygenase-like lactoylglutathione lyase family enzyme